jgi:hypothetical protein
VSVWRRLQLALAGRRPGRRHEIELPVSLWPEHFISRYERWEMEDRGEDRALLQKGDDLPE